MLSFKKFLIIRKPCLLNGNKAGSHDVQCSDISIFQGLFKVVIFFFFH